MPVATALSPGLDDPVHDAQATFRAVLDALARPGLPQALRATLRPPAPLTPELAAIALTLVDADTPVWLDPVLDTQEVAGWLRFHAGAPLVAEPSRAAFALVADARRCPPLDAFNAGTPAYPDASTTVVLALDALTSGEGLRLTGPGIRGEVHLSLSPRPAGWPAALADNHARFPLGVDLILTAPGRVAGLPRSTSVAEG